MPHADASRFKHDITKEEAYAQVLEQAKLLFEGQRNWVCNLANTASLLHYAYASLPRPSSSVNWTGFYVLDPLSLPAQRSNFKPNSTTSSPTPQLILGPFIGRVACQTILFARGVCGTAAYLKTTQLVPNVEDFPGHIACDGDSKSEVVVPILVKGEVVGIIDVDCSQEEGFDEVDVRWLEELAGVLAGACDW